MAAMGDVPNTTKNVVSVGSGHIDQLSENWEKKVSWQSDKYSADFFLLSQNIIR